MIPSERRELEYEILLENARRAEPDLTVEEANGCCLAFFSTFADWDLLASMAEEIGQREQEAVYAADVAHAAERQ